MENKNFIKLPDGDTFPIPEKSTIQYINGTKITTTPNGCVIKEFPDGKHVQMISKLQGYEVQTDWIGQGIIRKVWDNDGNLRFRVATRRNQAESIAHETCYRDKKLQSTCLTMLSLKTLKSMHIAKKGGKVYVVDPTSWMKPTDEDEIQGFPTNKRLMSIRSIAQFIQTATKQKGNE